MADRYRLKLKSLKFLSAVDYPAQADAAKALLLKRAGGHDKVKLTARAVKTSDELGLVFGYAFASSLDGGETPYVDLQRDAIEPDFLKAAMDFIADGGATDVNHDRNQDGRIIFAWPLLPEINQAMGIKANTVGLAVAVKPSAETFEAFKRGELTGFSIDGLGVREEMKRTPIAAGTDLERLADVGAKLQRAYFAGLREVGKAAPAGSPNDEDLEAHLQDLLSKLSDEDIADIGTLAESMHADPSYAEETDKGLRKSRFSTLSDKLGAKGAENPDALAAYIGRKKYGAGAFARMAARGRRGKSARGLRKMVVLTSIEDGHQHAIDLDDPADWCGDKLCTSPATAAGAEMSHTHAWTFDRQTGEVTIATDAGHSHAVAEKVPQNVLSMFALDEQQEQQADAQRLLEQVLDGGAGSDVTVTIAARDPRAGISTPNREPRDRGFVAKEQPTMPDAKDLEIADLKKKLANALALATLTDAQRAYHKTLAGDRADAFIAKAFDEREKEVAPTYTCKATGQVYRASDDPRTVELAKQLDKQHDELAKRDEAIEKAEIARVAKEHLGALAGSDDVHALVIGALRKSGADKAKVDEALTAMKGWNAHAMDAARIKGVNPGSDAPTDADSAYQALEKGVRDFAKANNIDKVWTDGLAAFVKTENGAALKAAYDQAKNVQ